MKFLPTLALICVLLGLGPQPRLLSQEADDTPRFALLIGINEYANLSPAEQLDGSENDIQLIRDVLVARFGFADQNIIQLLNREATASAIRASFGQLVDKVNAIPGGKKAQVYVHFSGHGSQVADQPEGDSDRDESDGLDETLVPHDADRQGGEKDIRDDEINELINQVVGEAGQERANVILVYDCCHSGSGARGDTKVRQLRRPTPAISEALAINRKGLPAGVVFLSACHETEVEPEFREDGKAYGLLTRFLAQIMMEQSELSTMSYDLLHDALRSRYQKDRRVVQAPHPQLESSDLNTRRLPILGATQAIDRPASFPVSIAAGDNPLRLQAGQLHGIGLGAILELYSDPESLAQDRSSGFVEVRKVDQFESEAAIVAFDEAKQAYVDAETPAGFSTGLAELRAAGPPEKFTKLKIVLAEDATQWQLASLDNEKLPRGLVQHLQTLSAPGRSQSIELVDSADAATDLILKVSGGQACLFPATGVSLYDASTASDLPEALRGGWGPFDAQGLDAEGATVGDYVSRIARANRIRSFAAQNSGSLPSNQVDFEILKVQTDADDNIVSSERIGFTRDKRIVLEVGDRYAVKFKNLRESQSSLYFTALEITPDMGIQVVAPYLESEIKLAPGEEYLCDPFECDAPGTLNEILLVTTEPHDFSFVEQAELPRTRGASPEGAVGDLQDRLASTLFPNQANTRGKRVPKKSSGAGWYSQIIEWQVMPKTLALKTRGAPVPPAASLIIGPSLGPAPTPLTPGVASPPAVAQAAAPEPDKSLTTKATNDGYELVTVFYGTDRKAILADDGIAEKAFPLIPSVCLAFLALVGWFAWKKQTKLRMGLAGVALVATAFTSVQYFVSMQNRDIGLARTGIQYGRERSQLQVGRCEVSIPEDHRVGFIESPSILSLEFRENPEKHVILDKITRDDNDDFYRYLNEVLDRSPRREAMVFVHGFNVSFEDAARRTGQMAYDLKYQGAPIFFSWPSQQELAGYTIDEQNVIYSVPHLKEFLQNIRTKTNVQSLNLIAHSMGNRAVTSALKELHLEYKDDAKMFNQVILAAPDVDAEVFKNDIAPAIAQTANQVTLYASSKDRALLASKNVHGYPRAGESGENLVITDGVSTIDVTDIDTSLLGHNYFGDSDSIVADMYEVLHKGQPPAMRPSLKESTLNSLKYWIFFKPSKSAPPPIAGSSAGGD